MSIPVIPDALAAQATVDVTFDTAVNPSEGAISSRKSMRDPAIRIYTIAVDPAQASEMNAIMLAVRGARWPIAIRDYNDNYQLTAEPQTWTAETDGGVINLSREFTPLTGSRTYSQRVLIIDERDESFQVFVNGSAAVSPNSWALTDPGILTVQGLVSGDVVTVTGQYLVPCVFSGDKMTATIHTPETIEISNLTLTEILETELTSLTA